MQIFYLKIISSSNLRACNFFISVQSNVGLLINKLVEISREVKLLFIKAIEISYEFHA